MLLGPAAPSLPSPLLATGPLLPLPALDLPLLAPLLLFAAEPAP